MKKRIKTIGKYVLIILTITLLFTILYFNYKNAVSDCVKGGHDVTWCKNEMAK